MKPDIKKALAAAMILATMAVGGARASEASTSGQCWVNPAATCYPTEATTWTPWVSPTSAGSQVWPIPAGTRVDMRCWTTGVSRLGTSKWFYVRSTAYPFPSGYVPANAVAVNTQIIVGHC